MIVWLVSYPKSGNTWLRFQLANYFRPAGAPPVRVDEMSFGRIASLRALLDEWSVVETSDLSDAELLQMRADTMMCLGRSATRPIFLKAHDARRRVMEGPDLFPREVTSAAVYLVRNPLDVAVSLAAHLDITAQSAVDALRNPSFTLNGPGPALAEQTPQLLRSWSEHVRSWTEGCDLPVLTIRYEDMLAQPESCLMRVLTHVQDDFDPGRIAAAVTHSAFERLQREEREYGFRERRSRANPFFKSGTEGTWRSVLTDTQIAQIVDDHRAVMADFGYLDERGQPILSRHAAEKTPHE